MTVPQINLGIHSQNLPLIETMELEIYGQS